MKFSKAAGYGICACAQLSHDPAKAPVPCSQLAEVGDMPERFLLQVMRNLVNAGVCVSTRGVDGGYRLARPANKINLAEIVEAIDGPILLDDQMIERVSGLAPQSNRMLVETIKGIDRAHRKLLADLLLSGMKVEQARELAAAS